MPRSRHGRDRRTPATEPVRRRTRHRRPAAHHSRGQPERLQSEADFAHLWRGADPGLLRSASGPTCAASPPSRSPAWPRSTSSPPTPSRTQRARAAHPGALPRRDPRFPRSQRCAPGLALVDVPFAAQPSAALARPPQPLLIIRRATAHAPADTAGEAETRRRTAAQTFAMSIVCPR